MSVIVVLEADILVGKKQSLLALLRKLLPETKRYKGFVRISIHIEHDKDHILFYQEWASIADYESYLQWRVDTGVMRTLAENLRAPPHIRYFDSETLE
ncbi:hypothetical protein A9Q99_16950 [Gammaproteobacteria bacterium 45_16_T64]|nr:hypothetical protein A9Q99_16950 [Gammaproteobacteria bacterium 45_16_T64]